MTTNGHSFHSKEAKSEAQSAALQPRKTCTTSSTLLLMSLMDLSLNAVHPIILNITSSPDSCIFTKYRQEIAEHI